MAIVTSLQISKLYDNYNSVEITFTNDIVATTYCNQKEIFVRVSGEQRKCLLFSSSMKIGKIILNVGGDFLSKMSKAGNVLSLRLCFNVPGKNDILSFFINAKVTGFTPYSPDNKDLNYLTLSYTQRPPDDLIAILGHLIEANVNFQQRKDLRIIINQSNYQEIGLLSREICLTIEHVPRKVLLADISPSGIMFIAIKIFRFHLNKPVKIKLDSRNNWNLEGEIVRIEEVQGRKDLISIGVKINPASYPMSLKMQIQNYIDSTKDKNQPENLKNEASASEATKKSGATSSAILPPESSDKQEKIQ